MYVCYGTKTKTPAVRHHEISISFFTSPGASVALRSIALSDSVEGKCRNGLGRDVMHMKSGINNIINESKICLLVSRRDIY